MTFRAFALSLLVVSAAAPPAAFAGEAKGSADYKGRTLALQHVYLVKGPDAVDESVVIRELVFSAADLGAKIEACQTMSCVSGEVTEGMTLDLDAGPRLNYWLVMKDGLVQYSGTSKPAVLTLTTDEPGRLAGKLALDDSGAGGPKVVLEFDATLLKTFDKAR